jgi:undecaprenyl-diphosphatase
MVEGLANIQDAVILGILEGVTEFIPVSSTGHLSLLSVYLGFDGEKTNTFNIFIQLGAILAVVFLYFRRFLELLRIKGSDLKAEGFSGYTGLAKLGLACVPAFVLGFLFYDRIKELLKSPLPVALALIVGGILMILVERGVKKVSISRLEDVTYLQSLGVGIFQCLALWPGMSRSGSTIIGAMLLGFHRQVAAEFSFLLAVPVMCAAVGYELLKSASSLTVSDIPLFSVGFIISFIVAMLAIKFFIGMLGRFSLRPFAYYRIIIGLIVIAGLYLPL